MKAMIARLVAGLMVLGMGLGFSGIIKAEEKAGVNTDAQFKAAVSEMIQDLKADGAFQADVMTFVELQKAAAGIEECRPINDEVKKQVVELKAYMERVYGKNFSEEEIGVVYMILAVNSLYKGGLPRGAIATQLQAMTKEHIKDFCKKSNGLQES